MLKARILEWVAIPSPGDFPRPGFKPGSPTMQANSLPSEPLEYSQSEGVNGSVMLTLCDPMDCSLPSPSGQGYGFSSGHVWTVKRVGLWRKLSAKELMLLNYGVGEDPWESLGLQGDPTSPFWRRSALGVLWKEWCWGWNYSTLATSCKELTHWRRLWCWEGRGAGGKGDDRGWDGWMASPTRWTWVWVNSGRWRWTGRPGVLQFMGSQRVGHDWATELNWTDAFKVPQCLFIVWWLISF